MPNKAILTIITISIIIILTSVPIFLFFFNFAPTGYSLKSATTLCKIGCENAFIDCSNICGTDACNENCKVQRGKCLFYC